MTDQRHFTQTDRHSRRFALQSGAFAAALAAIGARTVAAEDATPAAREARIGPLLVQAFSHGSFFPTQGDGPNQPPLTLILWDAADRGVMVADPASGRAGVVPADSVLMALKAASSAPVAVLMARSTEGNDASTAASVWLLSLVGGDLGSDPGAVTYQGDVLTPDAADAAFGMASAPPPEGAQELGNGFLLVAGLGEGASNQDDGVWLTWPGMG